MIKITNINGVQYYLNSELIELIESVPDTLISTRDGKKYYALETPEEVIYKIIEYKKRIFVNLPLINKRSIEIDFEENVKLSPIKLDVEKNHIV